MKKALSILLILVILSVLVWVLVYMKPNKTETETLKDQQNTMIEENNQQDDIISGSLDAVEIVPGLKSTILTEGNGDSIKKGQTASVLYTGKLSDGTVFDTNIDPKFGHPEAFEFEIGLGMVIKGWDLGVEGMKVGEKRMLVISPELAYGNQKVGDKIPANSTLIFEVELKAIK